MHDGNQEELPCVGISQREPLLVHQRDPMPRRAAGRLEREDGEVPEMLGVPVNIFISEGARIKCLMLIEVPRGVYIGFERGN